jgi:hypothetical protein
MTTTTRGSLAALLGLAALGACASTGTHDRADDAACRADAATALVGKAVPDGPTILRRTGSATVRRIAPGDMTTEDYRAERVTVTVADGRVIAASCG